MPEGTISQTHADFFVKTIVIGSMAKPSTTNPFIWKVNESRSAYL